MSVYIQMISCAYVHKETGVGSRCFVSYLYFGTAITSSVAFIRLCDHLLIFSVFHSGLSKYSTVDVLNTVLLMT